MNKTIPVKTAIMLVILVILISILGTAYALTNLGLIGPRVITVEGPGSTQGVVSVNVIVPESMEAEEGLVSVNIIESDTSESSS